jgi:hypothetical protein
VFRRLAREPVPNPAIRPPPGSVSRAAHPVGLTSGYYGEVMAVHGVLANGSDSSVGAFEGGRHEYIDAVQTNRICRFHEAEGPNAQAGVGRTSLCAGGAVRTFPRSD